MHNNKHIPTIQGIKIIPISLAILALSACSTIQPTAISLKSLVEQGVADKAASQRNVEPIQGELTLEEALARALKYNLDRRAKMMEEALALNQLDVAKLDMLPKVLASAGYSTRNNDHITMSRDQTTGQLASSHYVSQERDHLTADLGLSWSLLDLGIGYYGSKQQADRVLIAAEKRRKAMHLLMQDVRTAFWRAASAQKLRADIRAVTGLAEDALADSREAEARRIRNPVDALRYQRQVLENLRLLEAIDQELSSAQFELAALINAPLGQPIRIAEPVMKADAEALEIPVDAMEEMAMSENADVREQHYNLRIAQQESRKTIARLFPNISFNYAIKYDSDRYLLNQQWNEAGLQISYNLLNLLTGPTQLRAAKAGETLAEQRRITVQMAVLAQVHISRQQFANAIAQYKRAEAIWDTDNRIAEHMANRGQAQAVSKLDVVSSQTASLLSQLRRYQAMAQAQSAEARLQASLGLEPKLGSVSELGLDQLTQQLATSKTISSIVVSRPPVVAPQALDPAEAPAVTEPRSETQTPPLEGSSEATSQHFSIAPSSASPTEEATKNATEEQRAQSSESGLQVATLSPEQAQ